VGASVLSGMAVRRVCLHVRPSPSVWGQLPQGLPCAGTFPLPPPGHGRSPRSSSRYQRFPQESGNTGRCGTGFGIRCRAVAFDVDGRARGFLRSLRAGRAGCKQPR